VVGSVLLLPGAFAVAADLAARVWSTTSVWIAGG
jgi:hypothetical protein